jgi:hypothetical protein
MANTYTQIHIQVVFAVQNRECIILKSWKDELYIIYCIVVKSYDEQTKLDKKSSTVRKNEMHLDFLEKFDVKYDERYVFKPVGYDIEP